MLFLLNSSNKSKHKSLFPFELIFQIFDSKILFWNCLFVVFIQLFDCAQFKLEILLSVASLHGFVLIWTLPILVNLLQSLSLCHPSVTLLRKLFSGCKKNLIFFILEVLLKLWFDDLFHFLLLCFQLSQFLLLFFGNSFFLQHFE